MTFLWVFACTTAGVIAGSLVAPENVPVILIVGALTGASGLAIAKTRERKPSSH